MLGKGAVLTVTSVANRTSPVIRGAWILENVLGSPASPPPPGVENNLDAAAAKPTTLRERLEQHRANKACASCHNMMDPIGLALENYDHIGKWRTLDSGLPIDASGVMVDGTRLDGPADLRKAILSRSDAFVETLIEKLMTFSLGRHVTYARHARDTRDRARGAPATATVSPRSFSASSRASRFRCERKSARGASSKTRPSCNNL